MKKTIFGAIGLLSLMASLPSIAAITWSIEETGPSQTTITTSGSWDFAPGGGANGNTAPQEFREVSGAFFLAYAWDNIGFPSTNNSQYSIGTIPSVPWTGDQSSKFVSNSGDAFGFNVSEFEGNVDVTLYAPVGYSAGSPINATWVFNDTPAGLGITGTSGTIDLGANSVNWTVVPEPTSAMLLGLGGLGLLARRRRK